MWPGCHFWRKCWWTFTETIFGEREFLLNGSQTISESEQIKPCRWWNKYDQFRCINQNWTVITQDFTYFIVAPSWPLFDIYSFQVFFALMITTTLWQSVVPFHILDLLAQLPHLQFQVLQKNFRGNFFYVSEVNHQLWWLESSKQHKHYNVDQT